MRLNKDQRDGLAKVCDNLATALMLAVMIGGWIEEKIGLVAIANLLISALGLVTLAVMLRKKGGSHGD
jgi:hypothetical protein